MSNSLCDFGQGGAHEHPQLPTYCRCLSCRPFVPLRAHTSSYTSAATSISSPCTAPKPQATASAAACVFCRKRRGIYHGRRAVFLFTTKYLFFPPKYNAKTRTNIDKTRQARARLEIAPKTIGMRTPSSMRKIAGHAKLNTKSSSHAICRVRCFAYSLTRVVSTRTPSAPYLL